MVVVRVAVLVQVKPVAAASGCAARRRARSSSAAGITARSSGRSRRRTRRAAPAGGWSPSRRRRRGRTRPPGAGAASRAAETGSSQCIIYVTRSGAPRNGGRPRCIHKAMRVACEPSVLAMRSTRCGDGLAFARHFCGPSRTSVWPRWRAPVTSGRSRRSSSATGEPLLRHGRRLLSSEARAEDAVQQAFLAAWAALQRGDDVRELSAWLHRIVHNAALELAARRARRAGPSCASRLEGTGAPDDEIERREMLRDTLTNLAALPARQREALLRIAVQGESAEDVGSSLGLSQGAVRQLLYRARTALRAAATAVTPWPLASWLARAEPVTAGVVDLAGGAGSAGIGALLAKAARGRGRRGRRRRRTGRCSSDDGASRRAPRSAPADRGTSRVAPRRPATAAITAPRATTPASRERLLGVARVRPVRRARRRQQRQRLVALRVVRLRVERIRVERLRLGHSGPGSSGSGSGGSDTSGSGSAARARAAPARPARAPAGPARPAQGQAARGRLGPAPGRVQRLRFVGLGLQRHRVRPDRARAGPARPGSGSERLGRLRTSGSARAPAGPARQTTRRPPLRRERRRGFGRRELEGPADAAPTYGPTHRPTQPQFADPPRPATNRHECERDVADAVGVSRREWRTVGYVLMGFPRVSETFIASELPPRRAGRDPRPAVRHQAGRGARARPSPPGRRRDRGRSRSTCPTPRSLTAPLHRWRPRAPAAVRSRRSGARCAAGRAASPAPPRSRSARRCATAARPLSGPRKIYVKELLQAIALADRLLDAPDVRHLHAHFAHGTTTVTWLAARSPACRSRSPATRATSTRRDLNPHGWLRRKLLAASFAVTCTEANVAPPAPDRAGGATSSSSTTG